MASTVAGLPAVTLNQQESKALRGLLRQTIGVEIYKASSQFDLQLFLRSPETNSWTQIQDRATKDRDAITELIANLEKLEDGTMVPSYIPKIVHGVSLWGEKRKPICAIRELPQDQRFDSLG